MENQSPPAAAGTPKWEEFTHPLLYPVPTEGQTLASVTFREPDGEALEAIDNLNLDPGKPMRVSQVLGIIAALSGIPIDTVRKFHARDIRALGEAASPLLEGAGTEGA